MLGKYKTHNIRLNGSSVEEKRAELLEYFIKTYELYEKLFEILLDDTVFYEQPESLRHPIIFYFGHTAAFYINKLVLSKKVERINPSFESIFAIGVDEMNWDDLNQSRYQWPSVAETRAYRLDVKKAVIDFIKNESFVLPIQWDDSLWTVLMGIEHERIHLETSSVLIRQLPIDKVKEHPLFLVCEDVGKNLKNVMQNVEGGIVRLGKKRSDEFYGWDNEYGCFEVTLDDFKASKQLVSNGEFLEFVLDGGYEKSEFWDDEGKAWLDYKKAKHPLFWIKNGDGYKYRAITKEMDLPLNWPVDVNCLEAIAYCSWLSNKDGKNYTLPSEAEWHRMAEVCGIEEEMCKANINLESYASACPVDSFGHGEFFDVCGNVWQWTSSAIYPFEGFEAHPLYDDFSIPTFDDRHNLIKGGSFISTGNEVLFSSRYAFRRHFPQHAGFRYVESKNISKKQVDIYESDAAVSEYLEFHYGDEYFSIPNFPAKIARMAISLSAGTKQKKALELGCAVGRCSFELAKVFEEVTAIDFSTRFVKNAVLMKNSGHIKYKIKTHGDIFETKEVWAEEFDIDADVRQKVQFWQGDACNLKPHFSGYDLIVAANLIDRLYDPHKFLIDMCDRINDDGILLIASPYSWDESFTAKEKWIGGKDGIEPFDAISQILSMYFTIVMEPLDVEFVMRESARKYQHTISQVSAWKKKSKSGK